MLNLSVQNALDCLSENFNLKNFPGGACAGNSLEKFAVRSPDVATLYYIRALLSQNPPSAPDLSWGANTANITVNVWDFGPLGTSITPLQTGGLPTFATIFNSFIDIIHSIENKAIKRYDVRKFEL